MEHISFSLLGLGSGAAYAAIAIALVLTYRSSGVINFAAASFAMYGGVTYSELRDQGHLFNPIPGLPAEIHIADHVPTLLAMFVACALTALLSVLAYVVIFRPLKHAHALSKVVASIGLMLLLQNVVGLQLDGARANSNPFFPTDVWNIGDAAVPVDRILLGMTVAVLALVLWVLYRFTKFGLQTRAAAETEEGTVLVGLSPDRIALSNWAISGAVAGLAGILVSPLVPLNPSAYVLFIVPALAVALIARFSSLWVALCAGLLLGMVQSELSILQVKTWWPKVLGTSMGDVVPFIAIVLILVLRGERLPSRGTILPTPLPEARPPRHVRSGTIILTVVGVVGLVVLTGGYRVALIQSMILAIVALSLVVVTGYTGQISLAQLTLAGIGAFFLVRISAVWGVPFPFGAILAALAVTVVGVLLGLPAVRVRGVELGMLTLAAAVAVDAFYFRNLDLLGEQPNVGDPHLFGLNLGIGSGIEYPRVGFGFLVLAVLVATSLGVIWLRRSRLGHDMLAVRANERAAAAVGISVARTKLAAFAIGAFLAGLAGSLMAYQSGQVSADSFAALTGVLFFVVVYLAGPTSVSGALAAGLIGPLGLMATLLDRTINMGRYYELITALLLVLAAIRHPEGISGWCQGVLERRRARRSDEPGTPARDERDSRETPHTAEVHATSAVES
jgi:branched-subunit amino acid ABC-type transport system permease component